MLFVFLFLPGYLFLQGYRRGAEVPKERRDLYVVAETITFSILLLAAAWPLGLDQVQKDVQAGKLLDYGTLALYGLIAVTLLVPFVLGAVIGLVVRGLYAIPGLQQLLPQPELTSWEDLWHQIATMDSAPLVRITTKNGGDIIGIFGTGSSVATTRSSTPRDVYLSQRFVLNGQQLEPSGEGVYIEGSDIVSVTYGSYSG